jgi:hypothetical protein
MSEDKVLCFHELTVRIDQLEGNRVNWTISPDEEVWDTQSLSLIDLAESGAPLSAMGIRALWKLCLDGLIYNSLEQANSIQADVDRRMAAPASRAALEIPPDGATIN